MVIIFFQKLNQEWDNQTLFASDLPDYCCCLLNVMQSVWISDLGAQFKVCEKHHIRIFLDITKYNTSFSPV